MNLARRSLTSVTWHMAASLLQLGVVLGRAILLARWLPIETFGIYTFAGTVVRLTVLAADCGLGHAFLHRAPETEDEGHAAAVHFTLTLLCTLVWAALLSTAAGVLTSGDTRLALFILVLCTAGVQLCQTPRVLLTRRVAHRRLALLRLGDAVCTSLAALGLAWHGVTLWALLATDLITLGLTVAALYLWRPVWRPRLAWSPAVVRYMLHFGGRSCLGSVLLTALYWCDNLWVGLYLGPTALGFYARAYAFASFPRAVLAEPLNTVAQGIYAELKHDRPRLSQAFTGIAALLVWSGCLCVGVLTLTAADFIHLVLGARWLPMLDTLRLLLLFTLLEPLTTTLAALCLAVGKPEHLVRTHAVQLAVLGAGLVLLGPRLGIAGVALAVDSMLAVGLTIMLWQARRSVDVALSQLLGTPVLALLIALGLASGGQALLARSVETAWYPGVLTVGGFVTVYASVLWLLERHHVPAWRALWRGQVATSS